MLQIKEKLARIQTEIKAPKNMYNKFGEYYYRNVEGICEAVKPFLKEEKCCLVLSDEITEIGGRVYVKATAELYDCEAAGSVAVTAYAREADEKKKMDAAQITGATSSYARKYALNGLFLLDDTKDSDAGECREERKEREQQEQDQKKTETVAKQKISSVKAEALSKMLQSKGVDEAKVCALYKVESIRNLTEAQHENIWSHISEIEARCKA